MGNNDSDNKELAYEDPSFLMGRTRYRSVATGRQIGASQVSGVVAPTKRPLSWYLGLSNGE